MTIAKDFASKAAVAFVAVAMILTMFAPAAQAQSTQDLQKMIDELMAQIEALKGGSSMGGGSSAGVCPFTWTRDLRTGGTGADVKALQQFLNADADTRVAATGAGSAGMETETFGPMTAAAVSKFQVKYRADILTPAGLVNPTGFFGPGTRAKANALCVASTGGDEDEDEDMTDEDEDESEDSELSGEGTLGKFEIRDADDTDIQEGAEDVVIAELRLEAEDGDIEVNRMDMTIETDGDNTENDPWEVFEEISVWVDGDKVATFDASDEDNYLDEDNGEFRFTGLDLVLREDEEIEVLIGATVAGSVDDAGVTDEDDWTIAVDEMRYFDADGVAEDDDDLDSNAGDTAAFNIVEEGDGEELRFSLGSGNPDSTDIVVETDKKTSGVTVMEYTIEAREADIELNTLFVKLTTSTSSNLVIDDVTLDIDGDTFDAENSPTSSLSFTPEFDIDGDVTIDEGDEVTVKVMVDFRSQEVSNNVARYPNGTTIKAEVTSLERDLTDAEGASDIDDFTGSAIGDQHTIVAEGIVVPVDGFASTFDTQGQNDTTGIFKLEFEVTAVDGDFYILKNANDVDSATTTGVEFQLYTPGTYNPASSTVSASLTSTADQTGNVFRVSDGETETFTLTVTVDPNVTGLYRVELTTVNYTLNTNGITGVVPYTPVPASDFDTDEENING